MFGKRKTKTPQRREVKTQQSTRVFSYYAQRSGGGSANRQPQDSRKPGAPSANRPGINRRLIITNLPVIMILLVLFACGFYLSTLSTRPKIQIIGDDNKASLINLKAYEADVEGLLSESILNRSKLLIDTDKITSDIKQKYPELGDVALILPLVSRRPILHISPEKPALILSSQAGSLVVAQNGRAILGTDEAPSSVKNNIPVVQDDSGLEAEPGSYVLAEDSVEFITEIYAQLSRAKMTPKSFIMPPTAGELHVRIDKQTYYIKFDLKGDGRKQAGTYLAVQGHLKSNGISPAQYVDVRVPGRAFYK